MITDGTSQKDRFPQALREPLFHVHELQFEQLLAMGTEYARLLEFFTPTNKPEPDNRSTWQDLLTSDDAVLIALILAFDLDRVETDFPTMYLGKVDSEHADVFTLPNYRLARTINFWLTKLESLETLPARTLCQTLEAQIEARLRKALHELQEFLKPKHADIDKYFGKKIFRRLWGYKPKAAEDTAPGERFLKSNFDAFYQAIALLQAHAQRLLEVSLKHQAHSPAVGLYVAFLKLFQKIQNKSNEFTQKHLKFYHQDVLQCGRKPIVPDSAYLVLQTDIPDRRVPLPTGTEFTAGMDESGQDVVYTAANEVVVHDAKVASLCTLYWERDPLDSPEHELHFVSAAKVMQPPVSRDASSRNSGDMSAWPLFGAPRRGAQHFPLKDAEIGFAVASPVLLLKEGERTIDCTIRFESVEPMVDSFDSFIEEVTQILLSTPRFESLRKKLASIEIDLTDPSQEALEQARENAKRPTIYKLTEDALAALEALNAREALAVESKISNHIIQALKELKPEETTYTTKTDLEDAINNERQKLAAGYRALVEKQARKKCFWIIPYHVLREDSFGELEKKIPSNLLKKLKQELQGKIYLSGMGFSTAVENIIKEEITPVNEDILSLIAAEAGYYQSKTGNVRWKALEPEIEKVAAELDLLREDVLSLFREDAFFKVFDEMFRIDLTTDKGWYEVPQYTPLSKIVDKKFAENSLKIQIQLPPDSDPVVSYSAAIHGGEFDTDLPMIRFVLNPDTYVYGYSLLKDILIKEIGLEVEVKGVREVLLSNNVGDVDPNSPFTPFGPVPAVGSYFIVGNSEAATKQLTSLEVKVEWGDLPLEHGGFPGYYEAYELPFDHSVFEVSLSALNGGRWQPAEEQKQTRLPFFESQASGSDMIAPHRVWKCDSLAKLLKPIDDSPAEHAFGYSSLAKDGFVKFTLASPRYVFGHKEYPRLLSNVLVFNARMKHPRLFKPEPNPPYTPLINAISMNYRAVAIISPERLTSSNEKVFKERLYHIHPYGFEKLSAADAGRINLLPCYDKAEEEVPLDQTMKAVDRLEDWIAKIKQNLPKEPTPDPKSAQPQTLKFKLWELLPGLLADIRQANAASNDKRAKLLETLLDGVKADLAAHELPGSLFIGLAAREFSGMLTLLFHLRDDSTPKAAACQLTWHYLSSNRWEILQPSEVVSDTTNGFLSSGIVTLNVPAAINRNNTILPGNLYWLRVSVDKHPEALCSVYAIYAQALKVIRQVRGDARSQFPNELPAGTIRASKTSIPGIATIGQVGSSFGARPSETKEQLTTRISERLKHKDRVTDPWDYERLILDRFPEIFKVKCFPNMVTEPGRWQTPHPGHILLVVIPSVKEQPRAHLRPMANARLLRDIKEFLGKRASPFAEIVVRNPAYEQIQIRCTVKFSKGHSHGLSINALNQEITDHLFPWNASGYGERFGWCIRLDDIESYIRQLDYIDCVTDFSMLHIAEKEGRQGYFRLFDTARVKKASHVVETFYPWSVAIPVERHAIETIDTADVIDPEPVGIKDLELGSTFIISRG